MWGPLEILKIFSSSGREAATEDNVTEESLEEAMAELGTGVDEDVQEENSNPLPESEQQFSCYTKIGTITNIKDALLIIDEKYVVPSGSLKYSFKVNQKVQYKLVSGYGQEEKVVEVHPYEIDSWSTEAEAEAEMEDGRVLHETQGMARIAVCEVYKKEGGILFLETDNGEQLQVNMGSVEIKFIPMKGDLLSCEVITELRMDSPNLTGDTLVVRKIGPLRSKLIERAKVTLWKDNLGQGILESEISFNSQACSSGYIPHVGDTVLAQCIESRQGGLSWRATDVFPDSCESSNSGTRSSTQNGVLYHPKEGVSVSLLTKNLSFKRGSTLDIEVKVNNSASKAHHLTSYKMRTVGKSQICIMNGPELPFKMLPNSELVFCLKAKAQFIGRSSESLILSFDDNQFYIGCAIDLTVNDDSVERLKASANIRTSDRRFNNSDGKVYVPTRNGLVCPGVKPIKPPPFIPVQSHTFPIPDRIYGALLDSYQNPKKLSDMAAEIESLCPAVLKPLDPNNYAEKFHTFLYLEEMNIVLKMRQYYQERAQFYRRNEYYILEVPRLGETRPSIMIGDRVKAINTDISPTKFEGFVHKTSQNEVWLKFGAPFDDVAQGNSFQAYFFHSRGVFIKCHQAIEVFCKKDHLGLDWLFPNLLPSPKPFQVIIEDDSDDRVNGQASGTEAQRETRSSNDETSIKLSNGDLSTESNSNGTNDFLSSIAEPSTSTQNGFHHSDSSSSREDQPTENKSSKSKLSSHEAANLHYINSMKTRKELEKIRWASSGRGYGYTKDKQNAIKACQVLTHDKINWYNTSLNNRQKHAVRMILQGEARPLPYIIYGPPGTGKTVTMVETILQILTLIPDSRVLIATPSNSAADLIAERILKNRGLLPGQLVRLVSFSYWNDGRVPPHLLPYSAVADLKDDPDRFEALGDSKIRFSCRESLGRHRVTIGTCSSIGVLYTVGFPVGHFSHVFIDEAGQATEPEVLIPLAFLNEKNGQAILAGDHMQLGPVVTSELAKKYHYDISLLYRLMLRVLYLRDIDRFPKTGGHNPLLVTKLLDNYRSIPELLTLTSNCFYEGELIPHIAPENSREGKLLVNMAKLFEEFPKSVEYPNRLASLIFHGVRGENFQEVDSPSWFNPHEIVLVISYLKDCLEAGLGEVDIGIITPYQKQASKIRDLINKMNLPMPKVGSVEEFQGQERLVIIVSVVRSREELNMIEVEHSLGFLSNPFRVNVATSRARALLVVIGNPYLLGLDQYWKSVIKYSARIGGYTGCTYPPFLNTAEEQL